MKYEEFASDLPKDGTIEEDTLDGTSISFNFSGY
jgi:hypothetical protein